MAVIYKYVVEKFDSMTNTGAAVMPSEAKILAVGEQHEQIVLWAAVDSGALPNQRRLFAIVPTGGEIPEDAGTYLGTVTLQGWFVAHVYEVLS